MDILRLITSILIPPLGLLISFLSGSNNKIQKAASIISLVLSVLIIALIVVVFILLGSSNNQEEDLLHCRNPYYCEPSDGDYATCYYCKNDSCSIKKKITCVNDGDVFNYSTVADKSDE
ncbi:MAG: hypothetical protein K6C11_03725 [Bacilli bacterium]|nr:hypothetical protein [Bacilli bacterium]